MKMKNMIILGIIVTLVSITLLISINVYPHIFLDEQLTFDIKSFEEYNESNYTTAYISEVMEGSDDVFIQANFTINLEMPFITIDCDWYLNDLNWTNKNLSLIKGNDSVDIDIKELCDEISFNT